jgi:hypothetical protein
MWVTGDNELGPALRLSAQRRARLQIAVETLDERTIEEIGNYRG